MGLLQTLQNKDSKKLGQKERKALLKKLKELGESQDVNVIPKKRALLSIFLEYYQQKGEIDFENQSVPGFKVKSDTEIRIEVVPEDLFEVLHKFLNLE